MGRSIVKQPNGKWAIWSHTIDDFLFLDVEDIQDWIDYRIKEESEKIIKDILEIVSNISLYGKYYNMYDWDECLERLGIDKGKGRLPKDHPLYNLVEAVVIDEDEENLN